LLLVWNDHHTDSTVVITNGWLLWYINFSIVNGPFLFYVDFLSSITDRMLTELTIWVTRQVSKTGTSYSMFPVSLDCPFLITFFSVDGIIFMTFLYSNFFCSNCCLECTTQSCPSWYCVRESISCKNKCSLDSFIPLTSVQDIISLCPVLWIYFMVKNILNISGGQNFTWKIIFWTLFHYENMSTNVIHYWNVLYVLCQYHLNHDVILHNSANFVTPFNLVCITIDSIGTT
jgi:hypothetical protein